MQLVMTGVHQRTAPVALRERLAFGAAELPAALAHLHSYALEGFIISTCNRVEVYGITDSPAGAHELANFLASWHKLDRHMIAPYLYSYTGADVVRHAYRLAAGLDSMVVGEDQIVSQLKDALHNAHTAGTLGSMLHRLLHSALATGKQIRTQTGIARSHLSVVSVALDLARQTLGSLATGRTLVIGAGRMAELTLKHLRSETAGVILVTNRTLARAEHLAQRYGATAWPFELLEQAIYASDVVISCTASPDPVIHATMVEQALPGRSTPLLLLDLAVPRDIDRRIADLPGARLFDVDDMQPICEANRAARASEIAAAELVLEEAVAKFMRWWTSQQAVPTIKALRERAEAIRSAEVQRTLARLPQLSAQEQAAIQALSAAIVNKLLHDPINSIKSPDADADLVQAAQKFFGIQQGDT